MSETAARRNARWNDEDSSANYAFSEGGVVVERVGNTSWDSFRADIGKAVGAASFEAGLTVSATNLMIVGVGLASASLGTFVGGDSGGFGYYSAGGIAHGGSLSGSEPGWIYGQRVTVCYNAATGLLVFMLDGVEVATRATGWAGQLVYPMGSMYAQGQIGRGWFDGVMHPRTGFDVRWGV